MNKRAFQRQYKNVTVGALETLLSDLTNSPNEVSKDEPFFFKMNHLSIRLGVFNDSLSRVMREAKKHGLVNFRNVGRLRDSNYILIPVARKTKINKANLILMLEKSLEKLNKNQSNTYQILNMIRKHGNRDLSSSSETSQSNEQ